MNLTLILGIIRGATQLTTALGPLIEQSKEVLASDDSGEVAQALSELQAANDALHERVQNKLRQAARED